MYLWTPRSGGKAVTMDSTGDNTPIRSPATELSRGPHWSPYKASKCWPETITCQIFLQQRWVYSGSAENCNTGRAATASPLQVSTWQGKRMLLGGKGLHTEAIVWILAQKKRHICPTVSAFVPRHGSFHFCSLKSILFYFFVFLGPNWQHMEVPRLGVKLELQLLAYTTATAIQDPSPSQTYMTAHGNNGCLTHWVRLGIKPTSSWIPVGFISTELQWELLRILFNAGFC